MCVCHQWLREGRSRLIRHRYPPFCQCTYRLRLLHVRSLFRSIAMETGRAVLAGLRVRPLERREKFRPNRNRRGSPDQRREAIQRRKSLCAAVSAVRTHPANPFENRRNSASVGRPERVRNGDGGGQGGIRTHGRREPTAVFKTAALNHSATCPERPPIHRRTLLQAARPSPASALRRAAMLVYMMLEGACRSCPYRFKRRSRAARRTQTERDKHDMEWRDSR